MAQEKSDPRRSERTVQEELDEILVDCYGEEEEQSAWGVAFEDGVEVPFAATLLGTAVEVKGFRVSDSGVMQCLVSRTAPGPGAAGKDRWIAVEDLDEEGLPEDMTHLLVLYETWGGGGGGY